MSAEYNLVELCKVYIPDTPVTVGDIKKPTGHFACGVYQSILIELGADVYQILQIQSKQMNMLAYYEMYADIVPILNLCKCINYYMKGIGIHNFGLSDILNPSPKRNLQLMTRLLYFISYADKKIESMPTGHINDLKIKRNKLYQNIEQLKVSANERAMNRMHLKNSSYQFEKKAEEIRAELKKTSVEVEIMKQEIAEKKSIIADSEKNLQKYQRIHSELEDEIQRLQNMIVKSPEKLIMLIENLINETEYASQMVDDLKIEIELKQTICLFISTQITPQQSRHQQLEEVVNIHKNICKIEKEKTNLLEQLEELGFTKIKIVRQIKVRTHYVVEFHKILEDFQKYGKELKLEHKEKINVYNEKCMQRKSDLANAKDEQKRLKNYLQELGGKRTMLHAKFIELKDVEKWAFNKFKHTRENLGEIMQMVNEYAKLLLDMKKNVFPSNN